MAKRMRNESITERVSWLNFLCFGVQISLWRMDTSDTPFHKLKRLFSNVNYPPLCVYIAWDFYANLSRFKLFVYWTNKVTPDR